MVRFSDANGDERQVVTRPNPFQAEFVSHSADVVPAIARSGHRAGRRDAPADRAGRCETQVGIDT
jgi:hypothetical protein